MKAYQLKMIVKNTKPPVWKRFLLPAGITFSQLEVILEEVAEETPADCYEFEFYQAGIHLREWREGERGVRKWNYDYRCASDTYINSLFGSEKWFTFRIEGGREYRIEIEKEAETEQLYPVIVRQKGIAGRRNGQIWKLSTGS